MKILRFWQCAQNTKQLISVDSPSWAEQNGTNDFVIACTVVEILLFSVRPCKVGLSSVSIGKVIKRHFRESALSTYKQAQVLKCLTHPWCVCVCACVCACVHVCARTFWHIYTRTTLTQSLCCTCLCATEMIYTCGWHHTRRPPITQLNWSSLKK